MSPLSAILICDRDTLFRESLRNFLLAEGYSEVKVTATVREALARLRHECFGCVLIGMSRPFSIGKRLATVAQRRQPQIKILFLVSAKDQPWIQDASFEYVIKEYVFSNLLELM
jgi:DNA-binding NarL/FixJ family response regulator